MSDLIGGVSDFWVTADATFRLVYPYWIGDQTGLSVGFPPPDSPNEWQAIVNAPVSLAAGFSLASARLVLFARDGSGDITVARATEAWPETTVVPPASVSHVDVASATATSGSSVSIDMTSTVRAWLEGTLPNYGALIKAPMASITLASREWAIASQRPKWEIEWVQDGTPDPSDTTAPVVSITSPAEAAEVAGAFSIIATATDSVGVTMAEALVDGESLGVLTIPNLGASYRWLVDAGAWVNGTHTIVVKAWDAAGNIGQDTSSIVVANSMATAERVIYTEQMTDADYPAAWRGDGYADLAIEVLDIDTAQLPTNPAQRYNVELYAAAPGADADYTGMQPVDHRSSHGFSAQSPFVRWAIRARPQQVLTSWLTGALSAIRLRADDAGMLVLTNESVLRFTGDGFTEIADLSSYGTPLDMAPWNGKVAVAFQSRLVMVDPDSGELAWSMEPPGGTTQFGVIEPFGESLMMACATMGETGGSLFALDADYDLTEISVAGIVHSLCDCDTALAVGTVDGEIYSYAAGMTLLHTAATSVERITLLGGEVLAAAGLRVYRSMPTWAQDYLFGAFQAAAFGLLAGSVYAGGNSDIVWLRTAPGAWAQAFELAATTAVNDMMVVDGALYIATTSAADARLYRLEVSEGTGLVCGPDRPDFRFKLLRRRA